MAKTSTEFILTVIIGVLLIMAALYFGTVGVQPYDNVSKGLTAYPYEGFADAQAEFEKREKPKEDDVAALSEPQNIEKFSPYSKASLAETNKISFIA